MYQFKKVVPRVVSILVLLVRAIGLLDMPYYLMVLNFLDIEFYESSTVIVIVVIKFFCI